MSTLINEIDARTRLAGANQMELLLFHLGSPELFGINVFKVREVMKFPQLTRVPEADNRVVGMANIRGTMVPVIALKRNPVDSSRRSTVTAHGLAVAVSRAGNCGGAVHAPSIRWRAPYASC